MVLTERSGQRSLSQLTNMLFVACVDSYTRCPLGYQGAILERLLSSGNEILVVICVHLILLSTHVHANLKTWGLFH